MKKLIIASLLVAASLYLLLSAFVIDTQINKYDTKQTVIEQKAIAEGRVPGILPDSAFDISEMYDEKSKAYYGAFSYKEADEAKLLGEMSDTGDAEHTMKWQNFMFRIDRDKNRVQYRSQPK